MVADPLPARPAATPSPPSGHRVALAVTDGTGLFELGPPCAIFGDPGPRDVAGWYDFRVCAPAQARAGRWFRADTPYGLDALIEADTVIVPGCGNRDLTVSEELVATLRAAHAGGARIASICTGAFVLAAAGLLDGRRATTHWRYVDRLARQYPKVRVDPGVLYVDEGDVLTSAGKAAGIDLCLHLVRRDFGATVANAVARRMVVAPHRAGGQAQFIETLVPAQGQDGLAEVLAWATGRLDQPLSVTDLAARASTSPRQLARRFVAATGTPPLRWLHAQRIHRAQQLLESTDESIDRVASRVGLGTGATLRRHFHRAVGVAPAEYRRTFRSSVSGG